MRLTVKVLPLTADNAQGPHQAEALAAFQQRVFALPVDAADTFEQVWRKVEDRYKNNYLAPQHAAFFAIKKLQDGRDCDLDLGDSVGSIFSDEAVPDRVVQVIPSFANRLFSMPPDTNLRPNPHKRPRLPSDAGSNKRTRQALASAHSLDTAAAADGPIQSVESDGDGARMRSPSGRLRADRSHTGGSVTLVRAVRREQPEFTKRIKSESPELGASSYAKNKPPTAATSPAGTLDPPSSLLESRNSQQRRPSQKSSPSISTSGGVREANRLKTKVPIAVNGSTGTPDGPSTPVPYTNLKRSQLLDLLLARGLRTQEKNQRNKADMVRRLIAYDAQAPNSPSADSNDVIVQETPQKDGRTMEMKRMALSSTKKGPDIDDPPQIDECVLEPESRQEKASGSPVNSIQEQAYGSPANSIQNPTTRSPANSIQNPTTRSPANSIQEQASGSPTKLSQEQANGSPMKSSQEQVTGSPTKSSSPSRPNSTRSSPIAAREPAQWLARSPSPRRLESDAESGASRASSRSQSPIDNLINGQDALDHKSNNSKSDSESDEELEVDAVNANRSPSSADLDGPSSAQPSRPSEIPNVQSSLKEAPTSQPTPRLAQSDGGINAWFSSASQPFMRSGQADPRPPSASQPVPTRRGPLNTTVFTSLKAMLNNTRGLPNGVRPAKSKPTTFKTGDLGNLSQKKLPSALDEDSEDEESRDSSSSSSSSDEDS
jgi:hypothetical protein